MLSFRSADDKRISFLKDHRAHIYTIYLIDIYVNDPLYGKQIGSIHSKKLVLKYQLTKVKCHFYRGA
jgi:hypothetical protein